MKEKKKEEDEDGQGEVVWVWGREKEGRNEVSLRTIWGSKKKKERNEEERRAVAPSSCQLGSAGQTREYGRSNRLGEKIPITSLVRIWALIFILVDQLG